MRYFVIFLALAMAASGALAQTRVPDFALLDQNGRYHQLSYYGDHAAVVLYAHSLDNAATDDDLAALAELSDDVMVLAINAMPGQTRDAVAAQTFAVPVLVDEGQLVAETLGLSRAGETLVIDVANMRLVQRGGARDAAAGVDLVGAVDEARVLAFSGGADIAFPDRDLQARAGVSYTRDIVPILEEHCVACHHDGAIGPWSMDSHLMVQGFAPMMREVLLTRRMPPGQIDPHVGRPVSNAAGLTVEQKQKLVHWIDAGAPKDGDTDPLTELTFSNPKFTLGEPDIVLNVPAQEIPATGVIDYRYIPVQLNLDKDVWIRAMEFVPGDREVLHHVIAYLQSPADKSGRETGSERGDNIAGFAPGRQPDQFYDNSGRLIPKGSNLLLQMHYTTSGRPTVDETLVGIYLHEKPPEHIMSGGVAGQRRFLVPPGAKEHKLSGEMLIERDAYLYEMTPHMHYRGKHMSYSAHYPDGTTELLLSVPKYDFNWQFNYLLEEPAFLPAGTRLVAHGAMDNSDRNPANPDPTKPVHFGLQTKHEMFFGFVTLRYVGDSPANLVAEEGEGAEGPAAGG